MHTFLGNPSLANMSAAAFMRWTSASPRTRRSPSRALRTRSYVRNSIAWMSWSFNRMHGWMDGRMDGSYAKRACEWAAKKRLLDGWATELCMSAWKAMTCACQLAVDSWSIKSSANPFNALLHKFIHLGLEHQAAHPSP